MSNKILDDDIKKEYYIQGFIDGIKSSAWTKNDNIYVGITGKTLKEVINDLDNNWYNNFKGAKRKIENIK